MTSSGPETVLAALRRDRASSHSLILVTAPSTERAAIVILTPRNSVR